MLSLTDIAKALNGKIHGKSVRAPGPGHSSEDNSLWIVLADDSKWGFRVHSHSPADHAREVFHYVLERIKATVPGYQVKQNGIPRFNGGDAAKLIQEVAAAQKEQRRRVIAKFDYTDEAGALLYQCLKYQPKGFSQRRPDGTGGWINNLGDVRRVLYRLPDLIKFPGATAIICEGEKDANNVAALNLVATTVTSGKWTDECVQALAGRDVYILQDVDQNGAGAAKARQAAALIHPVAASVKIIVLPGLDGEEGRKDVTHWLHDLGHTKDELIDVCSNAPYWVPVDNADDATRDSEKPASATALTVAPSIVPAVIEKAPPRVALSFFSDLKDAPSKLWLIKNVIARGEVSSWIAPPGKGKSALLTDIMVHGAAAAGWRGYRTRAKFGGLYFALERADLVKRRLVAHRTRDNLSIDLPIAVCGDVIDLMVRSCVPMILGAIKEAEDRFGCEIGLVTFDTWAKGIAAGRGDESQAKDQNAALANLRRVLETANIHIATIGHTGKDESRGERGSNAKQADVDLEVQISGDNIRSAVVKKANDQPLEPITSFRLEPFEFGPDEDGDPFCTFILSQQTVTGAAIVGDRKLSDQQKRGLEALAEAILNHGADLTFENLTVKAVTVDQWRDQLYRMGVLDPEAKNPRGRLFEMRTRLAARHSSACATSTSGWPK